MSEDKDLIIITNKYAKKCSQCGNDVEIGEGFAVLDKSIPKDEQGWSTYCDDCHNSNINKDDTEDDDMPF